MILPRHDSALSHPRLNPWRRFALIAAGLVLLFALPLLALVRFALHSELYSYILLVPFISAYLAWQRKPALLALRRAGEPPSGTATNPVPSVPSVVNSGLENPKPELLATTRAGEPHSQPKNNPVPSVSSVVNSPAVNPPLAWALIAFGVLLVAGRFIAGAARIQLAPADSLAWITLAFVAFFTGAAVLTLGRAVARIIAFPLLFLIFLVPFPQVLEHGLESFLQHRSADASEILFGLVGTPLLRNDVAFELPGFHLQVAPECSGIHSTVVLFITSLVAGQLFLRTPWKRALFALVVIPLGIVRNAIRIVTIGELCVHVDPALIDSPIHHRGGPLFFLVSMVPFLLLLFYLRRTEKVRGSKQSHDEKRSVGVVG